MIQANVCAAETLEQRRSPLIYRVHDAPSAGEAAGPGRLPGDARHPLDQGRGGRAPTASTTCWTRPAAGRTPRSSTRWCCAPRCRRSIRTDNIGHFGLNLDRYAHFTSPIRRYADLIVHRALIRALGLGDDGLTDDDIARLKDTAEHITLAERRAMAAERDATDRYVAAFLADRVGASSRAGSPASPASACSCGWRRPAPTAWCRSRPWATNTSSTTTRLTPWSASAPARAGGWARRSRCGCGRRRRSPAACCSRCSASPSRADPNGAAAEAGRPRPRNPSRRRSRRILSRPPVKIGRRRKARQRHPVGRSPRRRRAPTRNTSPSAGALPATPSPPGR